MKIYIYSMRENDQNATFRLKSYEYKETSNFYKSEARIVGGTEEKMIRKSSIGKIHVIPNGCYVPLTEPNIQRAKEVFLAYCKNEKERSMRIVGEQEKRISKMEGLIFEISCLDKDLEE